VAASISAPQAINRGLVFESCPGVRVNFTAKLFVHSAINYWQILWWLTQ